MSKWAAWRGTAQARLKIGRVGTARSTAMPGRDSPRSPLKAQSQPNKGRGVLSRPVGTTSHRALFEISLFCLPPLYADLYIVKISLFASLLFRQCLIYGWNKFISIYRRVNSSSGGPWGPPLLVRPRAAGESLRNRREMFTRRGQARRWRWHKGII